MQRSERSTSWWTAGLHERRNGMRRGMRWYGTHGLCLSGYDADVSSRLVLRRRGDGGQLVRRIGQVSVGLRDDMRSVRVWSDCVLDRMHHGRDLRRGQLLQRRRLRREALER